MDFIKKSWVINLDRRPDRYQEFEERCKQVNIELPHLERFSAVDGKQLVDRIPMFLDEHLVNLLKTMLMTQVWTPNWANTEGKESAWNVGEIGCLLSHYSIYMKIENDTTLSEDDYILVLEDDIFLHKDCCVQLSEIGNVIKSQNQDIDIIWIAGRGRPNFVPENVHMTDIYEPIVKELYHRKVPDLVHDHEWYRQTTGYIIRKRGAINLANEIRHRHFVKPIDHCMVEAVVNKEIKQCDWFPHLGYSPLAYKTDVQGGEIVTPYHILRLILWNDYHKMQRLYSSRSQ